MVGDVARPDSFAPSDASFRRLVESVKDYAIFLLDTRGRIRSWNPGAELIKGYRSDEIIGEHYSKFYPPEAVAAGQPDRLLERALADGRVEDVGWRLRKDGSRFWASAVITALHDDAGHHVGFAKLTRDLTDRTYRAFVEATNAIVWSTDPSGLPNADSPSWRAFTGQSEGEWRGAHGWDPVHPDDLPAVRIAWPKAKAEKTHFEAQFRLRRHDGEYVWMSARAIPLWNDDGTIREWFGVTFDISERKRAELEAERSRVWWTTTLRSIGDAVIATDTRGRVQFVNQVAEQLTGWSGSEAQGRPLTDVLPIVNEETRRRVENPVERVLREGAVVGLANHTVLVRREGTDLPIDDSAAPIRDNDGTLLGVVLVFRDVTIEKRQESRRVFLAHAGEAMTASKDYRDALKTIVQLAVPRIADWCSAEILEPGSLVHQQLAFAHVDPAKIAFAHELQRRYPPDPNAPVGVPNVIRTGVAELYPIIPAELLEAQAIDAEHLRLIRVLQLRSAMVVPLRGRERVFGALQFVFAESGRQYTPEDLAFAEELARRAAIVIERRKLEEERVTLLERERQARAEAELANRAKDDFLATVSHELRTPLNAILGWASALRQRVLPPEIVHPLAVIERNARAQARLIEDVLDVSRIISGKLRLDLRSTEIRETLSSVVESLRPLADAKKIVFASDLASDLGPVLADPDRLQQILSNLLSNALKFTPAGGAVSVEARRTGTVVRIVVKDSGVGIEKGLLTVIFDPFRQADPSTTRRHGGLGLGLAIVRQLVVAHGGTVRAESGGSGQGSTFVVELPGMPPTSPHVPEAAPKAVLPRLDGLRVLVVDDEPDSLELLHSLLVRAGASVEQAESAEEAFAKLRASRPDVLVSDVGMPDVDGYTLLSRIRALPAVEGGRTPALALTGFARAEDAANAFEHGFQNHMSKPVDSDALVALVANLAGLAPRR